MNKVILIGRLTKNPEIRYSQSSEPLAISRYTIAINRKYKKDSEQEADFINCVVFGKAAEFSEKFFKKGMMIAVTGRLQVNSWEDQNNQKRWSTDVIVEEQEFTESKASFESRNNSQFENTESKKPSFEQNKKTSKPEGFQAIEEVLDDEDLPF